MMTWLLLGLGSLAIIYLLIFVYKTKTGSPYLPSNQEEIEKILQYVPMKAKVCDFGAGDGRVMKVVAEQKQAEVWGWEIEPLIWWLNKRKLSQTEVYQQGKLHYKLGDMWKANLHDFEVLIVYQLERFAPKLVKKCKQEMKPGSLIIANTYPLPDLKEIKRDGKIIIYQI